MSLTAREKSFEKIFANPATNNNSKCGPKCWTINLEILRSCDLTAPCYLSHKCYGCKNCYVQSKLKYNANSDMFENSASQYFGNIILNILKSHVRYVRWHAYGDIVNATYLKGMIATADACKDTEFVVFTKKYDIVIDYLNEGGKIPENLTVYFSAWNDWNIEKIMSYANPSTGIRVAYYIAKDNPYDYPNYNARDCSCKTTCDKCKACFGGSYHNVAFHEH